MEVKSKVSNFPKRSGQLPFLLAYYFDPWMRVNTKRFKNESLEQITSLDIWSPQQETPEVMVVCLSL